MGASIRPTDAEKKQTVTTGRGWGWARGEGPGRYRLRVLEWKRGRHKRDSVEKAVSGTVATRPRAGWPPRGATPSHHRVGHAKLTSCVGDPRRIAANSNHYKQEFILLKQTSKRATGVCSWRAQGPREGWSMGPPARTSPWDHRQRRSPRGLQAEGRRRWSMGALSRIGIVDHMQFRLPGAEVACGDCLEGEQMGLGQECALSWVSMTRWWIRSPNVESGGCLTVWWCSHLPAPPPGSRQQLSPSDREQRHGRIATALYRVYLSVQPCFGNMWMLWLGPLSGGFYHYSKAKKRKFFLMTRHTSIFMSKHCIYFIILPFNMGLLKGISSERCLWVGGLQKAGVRKWEK